MKYLIALALIVLVLQINLTAQSQAFYFLNFPYSVSTFGIGEQGVASLSNDDALVFNPAKLVLNNDPKFSFFKNPLNLVASLPITNYSLYHKIKNVGYFGISYHNWDWGKMAVTTAENPDGYGEKLSYYERSFAIGYARNITQNLNAGIQARYAYASYGNTDFNNFSISFGFLYNPEICERKINIGFSLMNLGPAVKYERESVIQEIVEYDPPPTKLNFGINFITAQNDYFSLPLDLSISKPFDKRDDNFNGQSSFKTLFSDWGDFPNDASLHTGLSFLWKPLNLGNNLAYFQEFYVGNYSDGIKTHLTNFYTSGANVGIYYAGYTFTMGYAAVTHNVHYSNFLQWEFPYETFQFTLQMNNDIFCNNNSSGNTFPELDGVVLSLGVGAINRLGKAKEIKVDYYTLSQENSISYFFEAAFYFNENNALISSVIYNSVPYNITFMSYKLIETKIETFSFYSSYRHHPFDTFRYLYLQGGLGIVRENPIVKTRPRYDYKTAFQISTGLHLDFLNPFIITPNIDYNLMLNRSTGNAPRIDGYNQFNFMLKFGYKIL